MRPRRSPQLETRKQPQQARSSDLVAAVLQAAVQVLATEGAARFTMARVAVRAGVSVGSLYQYFPNKAAILFRLQSDEWRATAAMLARLLEDRAVAPLQRLRALVHAFLQSECAEATVRTALDEAAPGYARSAEAKAVRASSHAVLQRFLQEAVPNGTEATLAVAGELFSTTLRAAGKRASQRPRTAAALQEFGDALADMLGAYLQQLASRTARPTAAPAGQPPPNPAQ